MGLREEQSRFAIMVAQLIFFAYANGYEITFGDAYRDASVPYGHSKSLHKQRLAIDLNLFRNGIYLTSSDDHRELGEFWEYLGGSWGGRFGDGNHYSLGYRGMV